MSTSDDLRRETPRRFPRDLGFSMPAEWSPHEATWLSWPHNRETWPGAFAGVEPAFRLIVEALAASEQVIINVLDADHEDHVRRCLDDVSRHIRFARIPTNDAWARDHGATFVRRSHEREPAAIAGISWVYNAWGGKYPPYELDAEVAGHMAHELGIPLFTSDLCVEGGALESNGEGVLMTTESCVLNPNRNPLLSRDDVEEALLSYTGAEEVLWLPGGDLAGDDTDGHVDNIARFVASDTVAIATERKPSDKNYDTLQANRRAVLQARPGGRKLTIVDLPTPDPIFFDGRRLPASYANFYIANTKVLVPTYRCPHDRQAVDTVQHLFPDREAVGIDCVDIIWGLGAIHCLTQQVPARQPSLKIFQSHASNDSR